MAAGQPAPTAAQPVPAGAPTDGTLKFVPHRIGNYRSEALGVGDVNGDGRPDILRPEAWFEAPPEPRAGEWKEHPWALVGLKGKVADTCQIVVCDVNGDLDVSVTGKYGGPVWFENTLNKRAR